MPKKSTIHDLRFEAMLKLLKDARLAKDLTQEELSNRLGQHRIYVTKIETGQRRLDVAELFDLCHELDLSIYDLIKSTFDNRPNKVMERSSNYILGFSNGYLQGRGYGVDQAVSTDAIDQTKSGRD